MDILDEKFVVIAFIAGLGVQSKDLMFYISKNPQARMAEVLAKTEKYINDEEALLSKQKSSFTQKEKSRGDKKREQSPKSRQTGTDPQGGAEKAESSPRQDGGKSGIAGDYLNLRCNNGIHLNSTPI